MTVHRTIPNARSSRTSTLAGVEVRERPVAYVGSAREVAACLVSWARLIELEPDDVFSDDTVRRAGQELTALIEERIVASRP